MIDATLSNLLAWSLQVFSLVLIGGPLPWLLRLHAPGVRYAYWRVLLAACLLLPLVQPWQQVAPQAIDIATPPALSPGGSASSVASMPAVARNASLLFGLPRQRWLEGVAIGLSAGAAIRLLWLCAGLVRLRRLRRSGERPLPADGQDELAALQRAGADVRFVHGLGQPVTFGALRPVVLLPRALRSQPGPVQRAVCVHELWHVRRRDWLWVVLEETTRAILWFHPAIGWLLSRVQLSREEVVDQLTVLTTNARRSYLEALLAFADEPRVYPATPFARRRHLFQRMLLISREAVMSSRRIVVSCAVMGVVVAIGGSFGVAAFPLSAAPPAVAQAPRDLRPGEPRPASSRETAIVAMLNNGPATSALSMELARLQEARGAVNEAEATLVAARTAAPNDHLVLLALAGLYNRSGRFEETIATMEQAASMQAGDPQTQHLAATFYEEKVRKDAALSPGDRQRYLQAGIAAEDRALALNPTYVEAMIFKNILLRHQANGETSAAERARLIAEADQLRGRAVALQQSRRAINGDNQGVAVERRNAGMPPPPPPPPPPDRMVDGQVPVRVGGGIKVPTKIHNVPPVYPPAALDAGVQGVIIIEAVIDAAGSVRDSRVLRSIPLLDQAALDAVNQWRFTPTTMNDQPVPVIMTVTVNFTLQ